jgi:hypothetical protein
LTLVEKEFQQKRKDNTALAQHINVIRKKEEARRKALVVTPTFDEGQSSKDVQTWRM